MRNFDDPQYKKARLAARKRDGFKCKRCGETKKLQVHHIKSWANYPTLRCDVSNLITLCKSCHKMMYSSEEAFASYCYSLINEEGGVYNLFAKYGVDKDG